MVSHFFVAWVGDLANQRNEGPLTANRLSADADAKRPTADQFSLTAYAADSTKASQLGRHVQRRQAAIPDAERAAGRPESFSQPEPSLAPARRTDMVRLSEKAGRKRFGGRLRRSRGKNSGSAGVTPNPIFSDLPAFWPLRKPPPPAVQLARTSALPPPRCPRSWNYVAGHSSVSRPSHAAGK